MKALFAPLIIIGAVVLTGCGSAQVPMGDADEVPIDERLIGEWLASDDDEDETMTLKIWAFNETEYYLEWISEDEDDDLARFRAFSTNVDGVLFSNVVCISCDDEDEDEGEAKWYFFRYDMEGSDVLILQEIDSQQYRDAIGDMTRSRDVRRYIARHLDDDDFFDDEVIRFERVFSEE